jgi:hypothetical protein
MAVTSIVHERIKNHIENTCKGNFETSYLKSLEEVSASIELRHNNNIFWVYMSCRKLRSDILKCKISG